MRHTGYWRKALLVAGLGAGLAAGSTPAFARHEVDCGVNPYNVDCVNKTGPSAFETAPVQPVYPGESGQARQGRILDHYKHAVPRHIGASGHHVHS